MPFKTIEIKPVCYLCHLTHKKETHPFLFCFVDEKGNCASHVKRRMVQIA